MGMIALQKNLTEGPQHALSGSPSSNAVFSKPLDAKLKTSSAKREEMCQFCACLG